MRNHAVVNAGTKVLFPKIESGLRSTGTIRTSSGSRPPAPAGARLGVETASRFQRSSLRIAEISSVGGRAFERDGCCNEFQRPWRIRFLRMRSLKLGLRTRWAPSPARPFTGKKVMEISKRHELPRRALRGRASNRSLSDLWNWDVPGRTNCSHLQDHFAVLGPCIMRRSRGFGI